MAAAFLAGRGATTLLLARGMAATGGAGGACGRLASAARPTAAAPTSLPLLLRRSFAADAAYDINSRTKPHLNIGTIGHVDHGKTTLTAAITKVQRHERLEMGGERARRAAGGDSIQAGEADGAWKGGRAPLGDLANWAPGNACARPGRGRSG